MEDLWAPGQGQEMYLDLPSLPASWPPIGGAQWGRPPQTAAAADSYQPVLPVITTAPTFQQQPASSHLSDAATLPKTTARRCSKPKVAGKATAAGAGGGEAVRRVQPHISRQQRRQAVRQQREVDQSTIKALEHQLGALRQQLQSLTVQNKHLKQRQAALHATLDMEQQIQAAAATKQPSLPGSGPSAAASWHSGDEVAGDDRLSFTLGASDSGSDEEAASGSEVEVTVGRLLAQLSASTAPRSSGPGQAAGTGKQQQEAKADAGPGSRQQAAASAARGGSSSQASGSDWFFAASLHQHVSWYKQQVTCLSEHLGVLDAIPPRLSRTLEDYQRHEEVTDAIEAVLAGIDDWTIHMAALRPDDYGVVLHQNLQEVLDSSGTAGPLPGDGSVVTDEWQLGSMIWQDLVEKLALTQQQEQTLEAHQALFEQRAEALAGSKAAVFAAIADAAAKPEDQTAAIELVEGTEALRASLQQDFSLKAPVMISLRKILTPMQMARLTVNCWPFYCAMKHISRAHKDRTQQQRSGGR
ncbi:hypothetical protein D9Q98_007793 [Chlorella vulgaris]|uniref:Uncharacterized protein n=1 Tax=Chlorella vulgaris TaxID=3077 RepID=A0A9D4YTI1_CHLVU|nr:hypothetical protein D9Q98_007793 [Chlorella vulgaris]